MSLFSFSISPCWLRTPKMIISTFMFIYRQKINFITHIFLEISQRYANRTGGEISISTLVFNLDYFQKKLMAKFFKKSKKSHFRAILSPFSWKKGLCQFLNVPIIYHLAKNQKKINEKECWDIFQKFHYTRYH